MAERARRTHEGEVVGHVFGRDGQVGVWILEPALTEVDVIASYDGESRCAGEIEACCTDDGVDFSLCNFPFVRTSQTLRCEALYVAPYNLAIWVAKRFEIAVARGRSPASNLASVTAFLLFASC